MKKNEAFLNGLDEQTPTVSKSLSFESVDTGDFDIHDWKEEKTFTGQYVRQFISEEYGGTDPVTGLLFQEYGTNMKVVLSNNYQLEKLFVHKTSETVIDWEKNPIFEITRGEDKKKKDGKSFATFTIKVAYL